MERRVLKVAGLVWGIPPEAYAQALAAAKTIVDRDDITTLCWDGDKHAYEGADGAPAAASFTRLLIDLQAAYPHLELLFFKKAGKAAGLVSGLGQTAADAHGNVLGPFPFLAPSNTTIHSADELAPPLQPGRHRGIEFAGEMRGWHDLGLKGLAWVKAVLGVPRVSYLIVGLGKTVEAELAAVKEAPSQYPTGLEVTLIEVARP